MRRFSFLNPRKSEQPCYVSGCKNKGSREMTVYNLNPTSNGKRRPEKEKLICDRCYFQTLCDGFVQEQAASPRPVRCPEKNVRYCLESSELGSHKKTLKQYFCLKCGDTYLGRNQFKPDLSSTAGWYTTTFGAAANLDEATHKPTPPPRRPPKQPALRKALEQQRLNPAPDHSITQALILKLKEELEHSRKKQ